jgi:hypothetical protein
MRRASHKQVHTRSTVVGPTYGGRTMRTGRPRTVVWFCVLAAALTLSACFSGPSKKPAPKPDWLSVKTTVEVSGVVIEKVTYTSGGLTIVGQVCRPAGEGLIRSSSRTTAGSVAYRTGVTRTGSAP